MSDPIGSVARGGAALGVLRGVVVSAGLALGRYATEGLSSHPLYNLRDPLRSAEQFLVSLGGTMLAAARRGAQSILELLYEASADVGVWFLHHTNPPIQKGSGSRF